MLGWATSKENANKGIISYSPNLSELDLSVINLGQFTLYAVWDDGTLQYPTWNKQDKGYNAVQWYTNPELSALLNTNDAKTSNQMIKTKAVLDQSTGKYIFNVYAKFTPMSYTIKFDANGGTGSKTAETHHNADTIVTLNLNGGAIRRTGWKFIGWSTTPTGNVTYGDGASVGYIPTPTKQSDGTYAITLYAVWEPYKYGINYNMNIPTHALKVKNGSSEYSVSIITDQNLRKDSQTYEMGKKYNLPKNVYSILGWEFVGWSLNKDGSGTIYADCAEITDLAVCDGGNETITLYAVWKVNPNTVGQNVENDVVVTNTDGSNAYRVYNLMEQTPQITAVDGVKKVIVDWSKYSGEYLDYIYAVTHNSSGQEVSRYGGGNTNLDIAYPIEEVTFIGNASAKYAKVHIVHVNYPEGAHALKVNFTDFNIIDSTIWVYTGEGIVNPVTDMILTVKGNSSVVAPEGSRAIYGFENLEIAGDGNITVIGGNGSDGYDGADRSHGENATGHSGGNGGNGYSAIDCKNVRLNCNGNVKLIGGNGGDGGNGGNITGESDGSDYWQNPAGGKGGNGGNGGCPIDLSTLNIIKCKDLILQYGDGGDGGDGGNGGNAKEQDENIPDHGGDGGNGGIGGNGYNSGNGGDGGDGGHSFGRSGGFLNTQKYRGTSGDAGDGGKGGNSISAIHYTDSNSNVISGTIGSGGSAGAIGSTDYNPGAVSGYAGNPGDDGADGSTDNTYYNTFESLYDDKLS